MECQFQNSCRRGLDSLSLRPFWFKTSAHRIFDGPSACPTVLPRSTFIAKSGGGLGQGPSNCGADSRYRRSSIVDSDRSRVRGLSGPRTLYLDRWGVLISALDGSRFRISSPAGAFIVLVSVTAARFGLEGLLPTVTLSGLMMTAIGLLRLAAHLTISMAGRPMMQFMTWSVS
jgi:hypothetical protein